MSEFTAEWFWNLFLLIVPAYFANATPLYLYSRAVKAKIRTVPIDGGSNFIDGRRIFGDGKTWEGFFGGIAGGTLVGAIMGFLGFIPIGFSLDQWLAVAFFLSLGAQIGDLIGSFIKRRLAMERGGSLPYFDQLGFVIAGLALATAAFPQIAYSIGLSGYLALLLFSYFAHTSFNWLAWKLGIKDVPW